MFLAAKEGLVGGGMAKEFAGIEGFRSVPSVIERGKKLGKKT